MTGHGLSLSLAGVATLATAGQAHALDCNAAQTQVEMNQCAYEAWQAADADLNLAYGFAIDRAKEIDLFSEGFPIQRRAGGPDTVGVSTEDMLRRAQRAWIAFRDAACLVESDRVRGGTMQPMLFSGCAEDLTRARTEQLRRFGELN